MEETKWLPIGKLTGDLYEIKMFMALLSNPDNFINGSAYWAIENHYASNKLAPATKDKISVYKFFLLNPHPSFTHILWINKTNLHES